MPHTTSTNEQREITSGSISGDTILIAAGAEHPDGTQAMHQFWALNLRDRPLQWQELTLWPGAERMLAVAAVQDGAFYLYSGVSLQNFSDNVLDAYFACRCSFVVWFIPSKPIAAGKMSN